MPVDTPAPPPPRQLPGKRACPGHGGPCVAVSVRTITHHLATAWDWQATAAHYYVCEAPGCTVAYFGDDGSLIPVDRLRSRIGGKTQAPDDLLCHCFGVRYADVAGDPAAAAAVRDFVIRQTQSGQCACLTRHPAGRCCLKDFPAPGGGPDRRR